MKLHPSKDYYFLKYIYQFFLAFMEVKEDLPPAPQHEPSWRDKKLAQAIQDPLAKFKCDKCPFAFRLEPSLKAHTSDLHESAYTCSSCKLQFKHGAILAAHRKAEHNGEKNERAKKPKLPIPPDSLVKVRVIIVGKKSKQDSIILKTFWREKCQAKICEVPCRASTCLTMLLQSKKVLLNLSIAILLQRPVYCFWRADFHGQGATLVTPDNLMYSLPTISP
jgi:hypothetical protein